MRPAGVAPVRGESEVRPLDPVGIRPHLRLFLLLLVQVAVVGLAVGIERVVVPLLGGEVFGLERTTAVLSFIVAFGLAKAPLNLVAGILVERLGARRILLAGWSIALPVPFLLALAPSWPWVVAANVLLGAQQGLCWSILIMMKVELAGDGQRGVAIGLNELVGYLGTAIATYAGAALAGRYGLDTAPFVALGVLLLLGLWLAVITPGPTDAPRPGPRRRSFRATAGFVAICQAGLVTKLADVAAWGLLPIHLRSRGLAVATVGLLAAAYPLAWAMLQPLSGWLSDRFGRRPPIQIGLLGQAIGLGILAAGDRFGEWLAGAVVLGAGTALVYPVLLAAAADSVPVPVASRGIGLYRFWRDLGFVVGGLGAGALADAVGVSGAFRLLAVVILASAGWFTWALTRRNAGAVAPTAGAGIGD